MATIWQDKGSDGRPSELALPAYQRERVNRDAQRTVEMLREAIAEQERTPPRRGLRRRLLRRE
jgi:hypothetical protein